MTDDRLCVRCGISLTATEGHPHLMGWLCGQCDRASTPSLDVGTDPATAKGERS